MMADNEQMATLRQALDDAVLTHTGRSIGDLASEKVLADIMPEIEALYSELRAENVTARATLAIAWRSVILKGRQSGSLGCGCTLCDTAREMMTEAEAEALLFPSE